MLAPRRPDTRAAPRLAAVAAVAVFAVLLGLTLFRKAVFEQENGLLLLELRALVALETAREPGGEPDVSMPPAVEQFQIEAASAQQVAWFPPQARETVLLQGAAWKGIVHRDGKSFLTVALPITDRIGWDITGLRIFLQQTDGRAHRTLVQIFRLDGALGTLAIAFGSLLIWTMLAKPRDAAVFGRTWVAGAGVLMIAWLMLVLTDSEQTTREAVRSISPLISGNDDLPQIQAAAREARFALQAAKHVFWAWFIAIWTGIAAATLAAVAVGRVAGRPAQLRRILAGWGFVLPAGLHLLVFSLGPVLFAFYLSFHAWSILSPERPFVGLENYAEALSNRDFWNSLRNTAIYTLHVPAGMAVSLGLALVLNRTALPGAGILRALFYLPSITSFVAIAIVWQWIYHPDFGLLNFALAQIGLGPAAWLHSPATALLSLMLMAIWVQAGYQMILYLAGLQNIPHRLYEAARIDGASRLQQFRFITLPLLRPTTVFILITSLIGSFQAFTQIYVMTEGGPLQATEVIVYQIYKQGWDYLRMGYASALSFLLFVLLLALTLAQLRILDRRTPWEA